MGFSLVSGQLSKGTASGGLTCVVVLPNDPTPGNIVTLVIGFYNIGGGGTTIATILDGNINSYSVTTNSPSTYNSACGQVFLAYLLSAPANANKTITVTFVDTINSAVVWAREFAVTGGAVSFDSEAEDQTTAGVDNLVDTPTITVTGSSELVICGLVSENGVGSAPNSPWTGTRDDNTGWGEGYIESQSSNVALNWNGSNGDHYGSMGMSFSIVGGGGGQSVPKKRLLLDSGLLIDSSLLVGQGLLIL